jgi:hypothetical protein
MNKEQLKMLAVQLAVLIGVLFVNNLFLTRKVADRVMQTLKRDYVPGPYDPGFDPDKVPPKKSTSYIE